MLCGTLLVLGLGLRLIRSSPGPPRPARCVRGDGAAARCSPGAASAHGGLAPTQDCARAVTLRCLSLLLCHKSHAISPLTVIKVHELRKVVQLCCVRCVRGVCYARVVHGYTSYPLNVVSMTVLSIPANGGVCAYVARAHAPCARPAHHSHTVVWDSARYRGTLWGVRHPAPARPGPSGRGRPREAQPIVGGA